MILTYCPEMNEKRPVFADIDAVRGNDRRWYVTSRFDLKGRGVTLVRSESGKREYRVTDKALETIGTEFSVAVATSL